MLHASAIAGDMTAASTNDNFSQAELDKFGALAQRWWDPEGPQKALHALNPARLGYVADRVKLQGARRARRRLRRRPAQRGIGA